jgi:hypothetical protein
MVTGSCNVRCWGKTGPDLLGLSFSHSDPLQTRGLLLRSAFKQPVADLLRYKALRPLPCPVVVAAEREELLEHDALGCRIDGNGPRHLHQRAPLMNDADNQDLRRPVRPRAADRPTPVPPSDNLMRRRRARAQNAGLP